MTFQEIPGSEHVVTLVGTLNGELVDTCKKKVDDILAKAPRAWILFDLSLCGESREAHTLAMRLKEVVCLHPEHFFSIVVTGTLMDAALLLLAAVPKERRYMTRGSVLLCPDSPIFWERVMATEFGMSHADFRQLFGRKGYESQPLKFDIPMFQTVSAQKALDAGLIQGIVSYK